MICALLILLISAEVLAGHATILLYHRFGDERYPSTSVSMEDFEKEIRYLWENNYRVISLGELVSIIKSGKELPDKSVVITIDDGYRSTMKAYDVLKRYGYPFTVFLYLEAIGRYPDFLSLKDIEELKRYGKVDFGNHSYSHRAFGLQRNLSAFKEDLIRSEREFVKLFGRKPKFYALPFGYYNREMLKILKERGYEAVLTQDPGNVGSFTDPYRIPRQAIVGSWSKMDNFLRKIRSEPLPLKETVPDIGFLKKNPPDRIGAELRNPDDYRDCRIYITEIGWRRAKRTGDKVYVDNIPELRRRWNRVGVRCKNVKTGAWAESFWMIIRD